MKLRARQRQSVFARIGGPALALAVGGLLLASCVADPAPLMERAVAGDGGATVTWSAPPGDTATTLTAYRVTPYIDSVAQAPTTFSSTATTQVVTGLTNGTTYTFRVQSIDSEGRESARSAASNAVVPGNPAALAAGGAHSCAIVAGVVRCWGDNELGQLGDGTGVSSVLPTTALGLSGATALTSGWNHSCARLANATVKCWGENKLGQLGYGATSNRRATPVLVPGLTGVTSISASLSGADAFGVRREDHTCAALATGAVRCWGGNAHGQLGNGSDVASASPVAVAGLTGATAVVAGGSHTCALLSSGGVRCWGDDEHGQLGTAEVDCVLPVEIEPCQSLVPLDVQGITDAVALAAGWRDTCALLATGEVACWGGTAVTWGSGWPGSTADPGLPILVAGVSDARSVTVGGEHACATTLGGDATCWGAGVMGELPAWQPVEPTTVDDLDGVTALSAGGGHACAVALGVVECWGDNRAGQLGDGAKSSSFSVPVPVPVGTAATSIAAGTSFAGDGHACALGGDGTVECWGANWSGELGRGTITPREPPGAVVGIADATAVASDANHSCAVVDAGAVVCWGANSSGQLGDGTTTPSSTPVAVAGPTDATAVAAGDFHSCALRGDGTVACWGLGSQLGHGSTANSSTPVAVAGLTGVTAISASHGHTCAIDAASGVWCWGSNGSGQLGDGTTATALAPVAVMGLPPASAVAAGGAHTCAIVTGGEVRCWGYNFWGQLGNGTLTTSTTAVPVSGLTGATAIGAGARQTCAVLAGGTIACWGDNDRGSLGNGSYVDSTTPVAATDISGATAVAVGESHACATDAAGAVRCWGDNSAGEAGLPLTWGSTTPVPVAGL